MAIFGIGVDIIEFERFSLIQIPHFANKILSVSEFEQLDASSNKLLFLAKKFSMKEAVAKALGVGIGKNLSFKDITISKNTLGKPLCFVEESTYLPITNARCNFHVSSSDTKTLIQCYCIAENIS